MYLTKYHKLITLFCYFLLTIILTFPLIKNLNSQIIGFKGDNMLYMHDIWVWAENVKSEIFKQDPVNLGEIKYSRISTQPVLDGAATLISLFSSPVFSYNLLVLLSFVLAGFFSYTLFYKITNNWTISFIGGLAFAFNPYHIRHSFNHLEISQVWVIPFYLHALYDFYKTSDVKHSIKIGLYLGFVALIVNYYGFSLVLFSGFYFLFYIFLNKGKTFGKKFGLSLVFFIFFLGTTLIPNIYSIKLLKNSQGDLSHYTWKAEGKTDQDYIKYAAKPWFYLLPDTDNYIFGDISKNIFIKISSLNPFYLTKEYSANEHSLYIGYVVLLGSLYYLLTSLKKRGSKQPSLLFLTFLVLSFIVLSFPPVIYKAQLKVPLPSILLEKTVPFIRVYARFGLISLFLIILIFTKGLSQLKFKRLKTKYIVLTVIAVAIFGEYLIPFNKVELLPAPKQYKEALSSTYMQVIELPKLADYSSTFYQTYHKKPVYFGRTTENNRVDLNDLQGNLNLSKGKSLIVFNSNYKQNFFDHRRNEAGLYLYDPYPEEKSEESKLDHHNWIEENISLIESLPGVKLIGNDGEAYYFSN